MSDWPKKMWLWYNAPLDIWSASSIMPSTNTIATGNVTQVLVYPADQAPEPVMWWDGHMDASGTKSGGFSIPLYLAPPNAEQIRAEERGQLASMLEMMGQKIAAAAIRSLK
jgi:hypothetical protein